MVNYVHFLSQKIYQRKSKILINYTQTNKLIIIYNIKIFNYLIFFIKLFITFLSFLIWEYVRNELIDGTSCKIRGKSFYWLKYIKIYKKKVKYNIPFLVK